eukprot:m.257466 g.257466  ORF g.257466 m.257466 type:complete len:151 (-) comp15529_c1_seq3:1780-2232(-)
MRCILGLFTQPWNPQQHLGLALAAQTCPVDDIFSVPLAALQTILLLCSQSISRSSNALLSLSPTRVVVGSQGTHKTHQFRSIPGIAVLCNTRATTELRQTANKQASVLINTVKATSLCVVGYIDVDMRSCGTMRKESKQRPYLATPRMRC